jgi:nickel-type superoxide dismutase maturation protease
MPGEGGDDPPAGRPAWWRSRRVEVHDDSMSPTLRPGDRLLVDPRAYRASPPHPGEIVVLTDPETPARWLVKRVAAVGPAGRDPDHDTPLPDGTVFVTGDAADRSRDSRQFGPVPLTLLVGRAYRCYAPADRIRDL